MNNIYNSINNYIIDENWEKAELILEKEIINNPENQWLLTQLNEVYYELEKYEKALEISKKIINLACKCQRSC